MTTDAYQAKRNAAIFTKDKNIVTKKSVKHLAKLMGQR